MLLDLAHHHVKHAATTFLCTIGSNATPSFPGEESHREGGQGSQLQSRTHAELPKIVLLSSIYCPFPFIAVILLNHHFDRLRKHPSCLPSLEMLIGPDHRPAGGRPGGGGGGGRGVGLQIFNWC